MKTLFFWLLLIVSPAVLATVPERPALTVDSQFTIQQSARDFFAERAKVEPCRTSLEDARKTYAEARAKLEETLLGTDTVAKDAQEGIMRAARLNYLDLMEACGDCATKPVSNLPSPAFSSEMWYISDGSCQLPIPADDKKALAEAFKRMQEYLLTLDRYPREKNGFYNIIEFSRVNPQTKLKIPTPTPLTAKKFPSFIAVSGPPIWGPTSFHYFGNNTIDTPMGKWGQELTFEFKATPKMFDPGEVKETSASGATQVTTTIGLASAYGFWYVNSDGNFRYYTDADFGAAGKTFKTQSKKTARETLLDTLVRLLEIGLGHL